MNRRFVGLYARAFSHTTESLDRVQQAMQTAIGPAELGVKRAEGHHGNPIDVVEAAIEDEGEIDRVFRRLGRDDIERLIATVDSRMDDGCNLHLRIDKQSSFRGEVKLSRGEDVITMRLRVRAFPAKKKVALEIVNEYLKGLLV